MPAEFLDGAKHNTEGASLSLTIFNLHALYIGTLCPGGWGVTLLCQATLFLGKLHSCTFIEIFNYYF